MSGELPHKVDMDLLLSVYGALLTDKQREIAALYYEEDLSLAEIAQQFQVSRQSIHDTLQRVEKQLSEWEAKLKFRERLQKTEKVLQRGISMLPQSADIAQAKHHFEKALRLLNDEEEIHGL